MTSTVCICTDTSDLAARAAEEIAADARRTVARKGVFTLCLSGGDTPADTYAGLGDSLAGEMPWDRVHVFWGDERCIPLNRPDNHFTMATRLMLSRVSIPEGNVHRIHAESDPAAAAADYEAELRRFFDVGEGSLPRFDLVVLGMGEDGHVASLFPGSAGLDERTRWAVDHHVVKRGERAQRVTLTMPVLTAARRVMFLVAGELKSEMLAAVLEGAADVPARDVIQRARSVLWMVDREAAAALEQSAASRRRA